MSITEPDPWVSALCEQARQDGYDSGREDTLDDLRERVCALQAGLDAYQAAVGDLRLSVGPPLSRRCVCAVRGYCADAPGDPLACPDCVQLGPDASCPAERLHRVGCSTRKATS